MSKRDDHFRSTMTTDITDEMTYTGEEFLAYLDELDKDNQRMGKNNKNSVPTEKMFTLEDVDQMTMAQFQDGQRSGMYRCHAVISNEISRLRQSLDDVWSITYHDVITPEKKELADKIIFAQDTLAVLEDMFQGSYFENLDNLSKEIKHEGDTSWAS